MKLAGLAKVGFFGCPAEALTRLTSVLTSAPGTGPIRVIDPCAGEGDALAAVAEKLEAEPFAVEVQRDRAATCRQRFGNAIWGDAFRLRLSHQAFSLLWLNPPFKRPSPPSRWLLAEPLTAPMTDPRGIPVGGAVASRELPSLVASSRASKQRR